MSLQHVERIAISPGRAAAPASARMLCARPAGCRQTSCRATASLLGFLALWQLSSSAGWINPAVFPPLDAILAALWKGVVGGALLGDIAISLQRSGTAFAAAVLFAIPLGIFMGQIRAVERALDPILQLFRQTSALALYPVFILLLGLGESVEDLRHLLGDAVPAAAQHHRRRQGGRSEADRDGARLWRDRLTVFRRVVLPGAVPSIFVGLRLSATTALLLLIASEMIGANKGVGFQVMNAQYNFQIPLMFAAILHPRRPRPVLQLRAGPPAAAALPLEQRRELTARPTHVISTQRTSP